MQELNMSATIRKESSIYPWIRLRVDLFTKTFCYIHLLPQPADLAKASSKPTILQNRLWTQVKVEAKLMSITWSSWSRLKLADSRKQVHCSGHCILGGIMYSITSSEYRLDQLIVKLWTPFWQYLSLKNSQIILIIILGWMRLICWNVGTMQSVMSMQSIVIFNGIIYLNIYKILYEPIQVYVVHVDSFAWLKQKISNSNKFVVQHGAHLVLDVIDDVRFKSSVMNYSKNIGHTSRAIA